MWKVLIAVVAFSAVLINAQERVDSCVQCQSSENNSDCVFPDRLESFTQICANSSSGSCFSRIIDGSGFIQRGCGSDLRNETCDSEACQTCQLTGIGSSACNIDVFPAQRLSCYICDGDRNSTCGNLDRDDAAIHTQLCPVFRNDDSCFSTRAAGNVTRGCASSVPRGRCDHGVCGFCRGSNCNSGNFDTLSSAYVAQISMKLLALAILTLAVKFY